MSAKGVVPSPPSDPRALGLLVAEVERLRDATLRAAGRSAMARSARPLPLDLSDDERRLVELLTRLRESVLSQPGVGQAITSFLVAEGRQFASTDEGARWLEVFQDAPEVERLRLIWEVTTLNVFEDQSDGQSVPSAWVDLITDAALVGGIDRIVGALRPEGTA